MNEHQLKNKLLEMYINTKINDAVGIRKKTSSRNE